MADFDPETRALGTTHFDRIYCAGCNRENKAGATFCAFCAAFLGELEDSRRPPQPGADALDGLVAKVAEENARKAAAQAVEEAARPPLPASDPPPDPRPRAQAPAARPARPASSPGSLTPIATPGTTSPGAIESYRRRLKDQAAQIEALVAERDALLAQPRDLDLAAFAARVRSEFRAEIEARSQRVQAEIEALARRAQQAEEARDRLLEGVAPPAARPDLESMREGLGGLRMLVEMLQSKAGDARIVASLAAKLLGDLDRILEGLE